MVDMGGNSHTLETIGNRIIVIDFWFTTCGPCIKEMPELNKLKEEFGTADVAWFGVTFDSKEKVARLIEKIKFDFTLIPDSKHLTDHFGIKFYPTTLIIDENRKVVYTGEFGGLDKRIKEIEDVLKKLTKNKKHQVKAGPLQQMEN